MSRSKKTEILGYAIVGEDELARHEVLTAFGPILTPDTHDSGFPVFATRRSAKRALARHERTISLCEDSGSGLPKNWPARDAFVAYYDAPLKIVPAFVHIRPGKEEGR